MAKKTIDTLHNSKICNSITVVTNDSNLHLDYSTSYFTNSSLNDGLTKPLHSSITNSGDVLQIAAEQIISTNKKDTALIKSVSFKVSTDEGSEILLSAEKAIFSKDNKSLTFKENVVLKAADKLRLNSKEI